MSIILIVSLLVLFLLVKTYFSNSYMYAIQDNLDSKNSNNLNIGPIIDNRYDQFNNRKQNINNNNNNNIFSSSLLNKIPSTSTSSYLEKALVAAAVGNNQK